MKARLLLFALLLSTISVQARMATFLQKGENRYARQDYQGCIKALSKFMNSEFASDDAAQYQAHSLIGQAYIGLSQKEKQPEKLVTAYHHLLGARAHATTPELRTQAELQLARLFPYVYNAAAKAYNQQNYEQAEIFFRLALRLNPSHGKTILSLGYLAWKRQDENMAYHYWSMVPEQSCEELIIPAERKSYERSCLLLAQWHYEAGQMDAAQNILLAGQDILGYTPDMEAFAQKMLVSR